MAEWKNTDKAKPTFCHKLEGYETLANLNSGLRQRLRHQKPICCADSWEIRARRSISGQRGFLCQTFVIWNFCSARRPVVICPDTSSRPLHNFSFTQTGLVRAHQTHRGCLSHKSTSSTSQFRLLPWFRLISGLLRLIERTSSATSPLISTTLAVFGAVRTTCWKTKYR